MCCLMLNTAFVPDFSIFFFTFYLLYGYNGIYCINRWLEANKRGKNEKKTIAPFKFSNA